MKKKYVISYSDYCGEYPYMEMVEAESVEEAIITGVYDTDLDDESLMYEFDTTDIKKAAKYLEESNGDGMPYVCIFCVDDDKMVFGGFED